MESGTVHNEGVQRFALTEFPIGLLEEQGILL
jgi:hypothetical protein